MPRSSHLVSDAEVVRDVLSHPPPAMSTSEVHAAIQALYGQNAEQQKAANAFLVQFATTPGAWECGLSLLQMPDPSVQYFGANMLYGKCKSDWATLPESHRGQFVDAVGGQLNTLANAPGSNLAARRLCLVMAAAATRTGPPAAFALVDKALSLASGSDAATSGVTGITLALEMQAAIAEETNDAASTSERHQLVDALVPRLVDVLGTAEAVFVKCTSGDQSLAQLKCAALHAALAWLKLDERGGGGIVLSPGQLASSRGPLLHGALGSLSSDDTSVCEKATEFCVSTLAYGAPPSVVPAEDSNAVRGIVASLVRHGESAIRPENEELARAVCKVAVAVVERDANDVASVNASEEFLNLTSLLLTLVETHTDTHVIMEAAADYFLMINTVSFAERHPGLKDPLFERLIATCLKHATLSSDFVNWQSADVDKDTFTRFREQILVDLLDNCFGIVPVRYLGFVSSSFDSAQNWQQIEASTFVGRAAAGAAKKLVTSKAAERSRETPNETRDRTETEIFLRITLSRIGDASITPPPPHAQIFASHPLVVASTCRLVGAYAPWLGQQLSGDKIQIPQKCISYLLAALSAPEAFRHASSAFRDVCGRCSDGFAKPETLQGILEAAERAMPELPQNNSESVGSGAAAFGGCGVDGDDDRSGVVEGLARVVAAVTDPTAAAAAAKNLTAPIMQRARAHADKASVGAGSTNNLAAELKLLASAVRFLEFPGFDVMVQRLGVMNPGVPASSYEHPAMAALSEAWPTLQAFNAEPWRSDPEITDATNQVYQKVLLCAKQKSVSLLPHVLEAVKCTFVAHHHPSCLDCLGVATEAFSTAGSGATGNQIRDPQIANAIGGTFSAAVDAAAACLSRNPIADKADVARALFEYTHKHAMFAPAVFLKAKSGGTSLSCHTVFGVALATLATVERDAIRAAVNLINVAVAPGDKAMQTEIWQTGRVGSVDAFFGAHGETVMKALLLAGAEHAPRPALRPIAQTIHAVRQSYNVPGKTVDKWITSVLADGNFPSPQSPVPESTRSTFCQIITKGDDNITESLQPRRWSAACVDFFQICRGELGADALVAHQM